MKSMRGFLIIIGLLFIITVSVELSQRKKFSWEPTFGNTDYHPFGCAIFDDVMKTAIPGGYHVINSTFLRLNNAPPQDGPIALLVITNEDFGDKELDAMLKFAENGNKLFLVSSSLGYSVKDTLGVRENFGWFSYGTLMRNGTDQQFDTIYIVQPLNGRDSLTPPVVMQDYAFYSRLVSNRFDSYDDIYRVLAVSQLKPVRRDVIKRDKVVRDSFVTYTSNYYPAFALRRPWGEGEITLISTPLIFTNYGMMNGENAQYIFDLLQGVDSLPLYRTLAYNKPKYQNSGSPFAYFHQHPPLRRALYFTLALILLFLVFTAKRRQRAMPVWNEPENQSLTFVKLIGTLYFQRHDALDLVSKQYTYFTEQLRRKTGIDIDGEKDDKELAKLLVRQTGLSEEWLWRFIAELRQVIEHKNPIDDRTMKRMIDGMRKILYTEE